MKLEVGRHLGDLPPELLQDIERQSRIVFFVPLGADIRLPVDFKWRLVIREYRFVRVITSVQRAAICTDHIFSIRLAERSFASEFGAIYLTRRRMLVYRFIHERLGDHRLVLLVVAKPAVADEVDDDVFAELHPIVQRDLGNETHRFGIIAINVEDRHFEHLRYIAAVQRGSRIAQIRSCETDLVVDDDVYRATGPEAARLCKIQGLHYDALSGIRRVAVYENRQHLLPVFITAAVLTRPYRAFDDRVDDFKMRRIEGEGQMQRSAGRHDVRRKTFVVFHVARERGLVVLAFEFGEQVLRHLAQCIHQHVQTPAMRHADYELLHTGGACALQQVIEQRDEAVAAFERKARLADVLGMQIAFERFGCGQPLEYVFLVINAVVRLGAVIYMYSTPIERQYVSRRSCRISRSFMSRGPTSDPVPNVVSISASPSP